MINLLDKLKDMLGLNTNKKKIEEQRIKMQQVLHREVEKSKLENDELHEFVQFLDKNITKTFNSKDGVENVVVKIDKCYLNLLLKVKERKDFKQYAIRIGESEFQIVDISCMLVLFSRNKMNASSCIDMHEGAYKDMIWLPLNMYVTSHS